MTEQNIKRDNSGRFQTGSVANPGGRPKLPDGIKEKLAEFGEDALQAMADALVSKDEKLRFMAAQEWFNRMYGRPHTSAQIDVQVTSVQDAHLNALNEMVMRAQLAAPLIIDVDEA